MGGHRVGGWTIRGLRACGYLLATLAVGIVALAASIALLVFLGVSLLGVGLLVLLPLLQGLRRWSDWEWRRVARRLGRPPESRDLRLTGRPLSWPYQLLSDRATWRAAGWVLLQGLFGTLLGLLGLTVAIGVPGTLLNMSTWWIDPGGQTLLWFRVTGWPIAIFAGIGQLIIAFALLWWVAPLLARLHAVVIYRLLSPSEAERLAQRVHELAESRAGAVDAHGAELRRIERNLHDGTQARLVSIAMRLGLAEQALIEDPDRVPELIKDARIGAEGAMRELREVIRTMYPPILADRGLAGAISALASRSPVPTSLEVAELGQVPAPVEAAAYFVVAEALTNVAKHSSATRADVRLSRNGPMLLVVVEDDGVGGAGPDRGAGPDSGSGPDSGTGIDGMRRRVAALDGTFVVHSPAGGPTRIAVEVPCAS